MDSNKHNNILNNSSISCGNETVVENVIGVYRLQKKSVDNDSITQKTHFF